MRGSFWGPETARHTVVVALSLLLGSCFVVGTVAAQPSPSVTVAPSSDGQKTSSEPSAPAATPSSPAVTITKTTVTSVTKTNALGAVAVHTDLPADLSVEGMFHAADPIVKGVMGLLALASIATWSIFIYKMVELGRVNGRARSNLRAISNSGTLDQVSHTLKEGPVARLVRSAELEMEASESLPPEGIKERVAIALQRVESAAARRISAGTGILASVGSTGPFVGLFGTVWGIMNSFIHISNAHTTNLSVVAPGIAEALLATAMGLVARHPRGRDLQHVQPCDRRLSRAARRRIGRYHAACFA